MALIPLIAFLPFGASSAETSSNTPKTDPHDDIRCGKCHQFVDESGSIGNSPINYDVEGTCRECHDLFNMHPVGVPIRREEGWSAEFDLPLVLDGDKKIITCLTCHFFHGKKQNKFLLREGNKVHVERLKGLCCSCHSHGILEAKSPHKKDSGQCKRCHEEMPEVDQPFSGQDYARFQKMCIFCHGRMSEAHFKAIDPLSDPELAINAQYLRLLFIKGEYVCFSCHDPHNELNLGQKLLKPEYLELAALSRKINPHWKNVMCVTCHEKKPEKGKPCLRMLGNVNGLCKRCHNAEIGMAFLHPVACVPTKDVKIPEQFPLTGGQVTCETCHKSVLQETGEEIGTARRSNSAFLRVYGLSLVEFCYQCHIREIFSRLNVHEQIYESGKVKTETCPACHYVLPEDDGNPDPPTEWETDPKEFCFLCHMSRRFVDNHPSGPHLIEPTRETIRNMESAQERIGASLPLFKGRITCSTCHDPHQAGILKGHSKLQYTRGAKGVRAQYRELLCTGCHGAK